MKISRGPEVKRCMSEYDRSKITEGGNNMYYDINRMLVDEKMKEMRKYALDSNSYKKKRKSKKVEMLNKQHQIQVLQSSKVG